MRNVCLLPTGGVWDSSVEVALSNSVTFLHSLWHKLSFSWEFASSGKLSMHIISFPVQRVMVVGMAELLYHRSIFRAEGIF